ARVFRTPRSRKLRIKKIRLTWLTTATSRLTDAVRVGQKAGGFGLAYRRGSPAQIFFLRPQLLNSIKRNQINQTLGFKGAARFQVDKIADLFSGAKPIPGWVKTLDPFDWDRRAARICARISEDFFRCLWHTTCAYS